LEQGRGIHIGVFPDRVEVDRAAFPLEISLDGQPASLRLGVLAPPGSTIEVGGAGGQELIRVTKDLAVIDRPIAGLPMEITVVNRGSTGLMLPGWLEVIDPTRQRDIEPQEAWQGFREEVIPGSGFFVVDGWQGLEAGGRRWTTRGSHSIFRNPSQAMALRIQGHLPDQPGTEAAVVLNGTLLGKVDKPGDFSAGFLVLPGVLGSAAWGDLMLCVNRVFNPRARNPDCRDLGVMVTGIGFRSLALPATGVISLGETKARDYLANGWSPPERWGDGSNRTAAWSNAPESALWFALPRPSDLTVSLTLFPFTFPSSPPQSVKVIINGRSVAEFAVTDAAWRTYSFDLPRSHLSSGVNTLRFLYGYVASPSKVLPGSDDPRTLAVALASVAFREER
jgi:hypothetical protein